VVSGLPSREDEPQDPAGRIKITGPGPLVLLGLLGLVLGWGAHRFATDSSWPEVTITWLAVTAFWFIALVTGAIAYLTRRTVTDARPDLTAQQGLARLVLGKTICRVAAVALGISVGVLISRLGVASENAGTTILRAAVGALGAGAAVAAGLLLEHACRVPPGPERDLP
jgi:L-cystine uptake protein TcyP (sodium:dicarboxylate symporter family)